MNVLAALEGFVNVPELHPLETLHNTLTYQEIDDFLGRVTTAQFPGQGYHPILAHSYFNFHSPATGYPSVEAKDV